MKKLVATLLLIATAHLYLGFYKTQFAEDNRWVFFIKHEPTLQMKFFNLFASDADDKRLNELSRAEKNIIADYCFYRLGIRTQVLSQEELDACKKL